MIKRIRANTYVIVADMEIYYTFTEVLHGYNYGRCRELFDFNRVLFELKITTARVVEV